MNHEDIKISLGKSFDFEISVTGRWRILNEFHLLFLWTACNVLLKYKKFMPCDMILLNILNIFCIICVENELTHFVTLCGMCECRLVRDH